MDERDLAPIDANEERLGYWMRVSRAYAFVFRALFFVLPLFVIVFMAICAQAFTKNSVFGFGKDILSVSSFLSSDYSTVYYAYEEGEKSVLAYRDGVAVITIDGIEIYSPDGERLLDRAMPFTKPRAVASAKYLVVYDFASTTFVVTNGYSVLFEGETDFPILDADVSDTGHFVLTTASDTHLSQVLLYDVNFNLIQRFSRNSATTDVCLSSNGKYVAFCGLTSDNGSTQSVIELYRVGAKQYTFSVRLEELALALAFTDTRHLALVTTQAGYVLNLDGEQQNRLDFGACTLISYDINESGCAFLLDADDVHAKSRVILCDKRGALTCEKEYAADLTAVAYAKEQAYLLGDSTLLRLHTEEERVDELDVPPGAQEILLTDEGQLRLVYAGAAEYVEFD
jgi:hypothetical protein